MSERKRVLITGASRGLGRALASACAERGHDLALVARDGAALARLAGRLKEDHRIDADFFAADLGQPGSARRCADAVIREMGVPEVLVNNAGVGWWKPFLAHGDEEHDRIIDVNLRAVVHLTHALLPAMIERGHGHIVNIASDLADRPLGNMAVYTASKYALRGFSLSLSQEVRRHGIKVSLVNPGMIDSSFHGSEEGSLDEASALKLEPLAELIADVIGQPGHQVVDELTVHAMGQDY